MKRIMVRYKVKSDRADENVGMVKAVYEQLARERPTGLRYATFRWTTASASSTSSHTSRTTAATR